MANYETTALAMFHACAGEFRDTLLTPGEQVLQVFQRDTTIEVADVVTAARDLASAVPVTTLATPCPFCRAFDGHMGDCVLAILRVLLVRLDAKVARLGGGR